MCLELVLDSYCHAKVMSSGCLAKKRLGEVQRCLLKYAAAVWPPAIYETYDQRHFKYSHCSFSGLYHNNGFIVKQQRCSEYDLQ